MSLKGRKNTIKNKFAVANQGRTNLTVAEYLEQREFRQNRTWTLLDGKMYVDVEGVLLLEKDFNRLYPKPYVPTFQYDRTNVDRRKIWMYE